MAAIIETIEEAEHFVTNLKRSDNWVSNDELIAKLNDSYKLILAYSRDDLIPFVTVNIALYYIDLGEYGQAWEFTEIAKQKSVVYNNYDCLLNAISLQYRIQRYLGNLDKAQELVNEQVEVALEYNDTIQLYSAFLNQAYQYFLQNQKSECLTSFEKAIKYSIKSNNKFCITLVHITYAGHLIEFKEFRKAVKYLNIGFNLALENKFVNFIAYSNSNFGVLYDEKGNYEKAKEHYNKAIEIYTNIKNINEGNQAKIMLAETYLKLNDYKNSKKLLKDVQLFSEKNQIKSNLNKIYELQSKSLERQGNYKESLKYFKKFKSINEDIYNAETDKRIKNLEIVQKIKILNVEKGNAEKMANIKHDFLANMSHEIRTPINSIMGICYLLQQRQLDDVSFNYVNRLKRSGENLLGIINDVLDISKIESGKMELVINPFSLNTLLQDILYVIEPKAIEKNIIFSVHKKNKEDIQLIGDAIRLQQILINLVSNSIKFTERGCVTLQIIVNENKNKSVEITFNIIDTGIGIPKDKIEKIFERYEQASATIKTTFGGTGLGLSISKKMVELMNGTIEIKSKLGKGSQFIVTIPFQNASKQIIETINEAINAELLNYKHILIADDNIENRLVAKEVLLSFNKTVVIYEAENGKEVLDILSKQQMDILFLDLDMPVLNGIETLQKIRKNKKYNSLKIIGNTASLSTMTKEELLEIGFTNFIYKPYKPEEFIISLCK